jgi:hypothetical protein
MENATMQSFLEELRTQRWDDHRYYHHSRINQTLHFISALSFMAGYVMMFKDPVMAALIGWLVAMVTRQSGHFFFEPKGYDTVNQASHEYKESIKVGYNLHRKVVLHAAWLAIPVVLWFDRSFFGLFLAETRDGSFLRQLGQLWLALGVGALLFRVIQLFVIRDVQTGLVWLTKILTDPFHDAVIYCKAPVYLLRGELLDPGAGRHA